MFFSESMCVSVSLSLSFYPALTTLQGSSVLASVLEFSALQHPFSLFPFPSFSIILYHLVCKSVSFILTYGIFS